MNRRGNFVDAITIMAIIFVLACGMMFMVFVIKNMTASLSKTAVVQNTPTSAQIVSGVDTNTPWVVDFFVVMMMFGLPLLAFILAFFNNISPIFFWSTIGFTMLVAVLGGFFASGYVNFISSNMQVVETYMPLTAFVMRNYVMYGMVLCAVIGFGIYAKTKVQNSGGF